MTYSPALFSMVCLLIVTAMPQGALAVDHNNLDAGRPLSFDDAESLALGEFALEGGLAWVSPDRGGSGFAPHLELLHGFALNTHLGLSVEAATGGLVTSSEREAAITQVGLTFFRNFNREYDDVPAFSFRGDLRVPTREATGATEAVEVRLRGIASRHWIQYDRLHLNLDAVAVFNPDGPDGPDAGDRRFRMALILGYSTPIGYPRLFTQTGVAELAIRVPEQKGAGPILSAGIGLRRQVTVRSLLDVGIQSDLWAARHTPHERLRIVVGLSTGF
jgi:hypothetical protein